ncbi:MAG: Uma2 family endonuclease [Myxococcota bacterium]|nr:Uma2 family endonuclease [Myxococcota bacterium]
MANPARRASVDEYLAIEASSDAKHEYLNGEIVAMAGASPRHNVIASNVTGVLRNALERSPYRVLGSDQRVRIESTGAYVYPDVSVVCSEPRFGVDRPVSLLNPSLVIEVLSPSTEDHDRGAKLAHYRRLASIQEVLLIEPNERRAELYSRLENGTWLITDVVAGAVELESVGAQLALDEIYSKTEGLPLDDAG